MYSTNIVLSQQKGITKTIDISMLYVRSISIFLMNKCAIKYVNTSEYFLEAVVMIMTQHMNASTY